MSSLPAATDPVDGDESAASPPSSGEHDLRLVITRVSSFSFFLLIGISTVTSTIFALRHVTLVRSHFTYLSLSLFITR